MRFLVAVLALLLCAVGGTPPVSAQNASEKVRQPWLMLSKLASPISVTTSSAVTQLPSLGLALWACNTGTNDVYLGFGTANTVSVTVATGSWLKAGTCAAYDLYPPGVAGPYTYAAIIGSGGSTTVYVEAGVGQPPQMTGSSGGGGGGSVTQGTVPWADNVAQVNGITTLTGAGATGTGAQRVTTAQDATTIAGSAPGTAGTASMNVLTVQGIAAMTPLSENVAQVNGVTILTGAGASGTGAQRVTASQDTTTIAGSAPGTAGSASTNVLSVQGIASMTPFLANPGTAANWGVGATGSAVPANAIYNGAQARSSEATAASNGNLTGVASDLVGKVITSPYANRENQLRCAVTLTASTAATTCTGMGAQGASVKIYITDLTCTRSDILTTAATMTLNDSATTIIDMPNSGGGGGFARSYNTPLVVAANTAFTVQSGASLTSVHCSATGFSGY